MFYNDQGTVISNNEEVTDSVLYLLLATKTIPFISISYSISKIFSYSGIYHLILVVSWFFLYYQVRTRHLNTIMIVKVLKYYEIHDFLIFECHA